MGASFLVEKAWMTSMTWASVHGRVEKACRGSETKKFLHVLRGKKAWTERRKRCGKTCRLKNTMEGEQEICKKDMHLKKHHGQWWRKST